MIAELIKEWRKAGSNYWQGVEIYKKHGTNDFLKKVLAKHASAYNLKRLNEAIDELLTLTHEPELTIKFTIKKPADKLPKGHEEVVNLTRAKSFSDLPETNPDKFFNYPDELQRKIILRKQLYAQMGPLHAKKLYCKPEERQEIIVELITLFNQVQEIWQEINYFDNNGHLMPKITDVPEMDLNGLSDAEKLKLLNNIRSFLSKNKHLEDLMANYDKQSDKVKRKINVYKLKVKQRDWLADWKERAMI